VKTLKRIWQKFFIHKKAKMIRFLYAFILVLGIGFINKSHAQKILFVDDNDYILYNTDTIISGLKATNYSFTNYNIEKNGGVPPTLQKMLEHDIVIWYASTDGVLLNFWDSNTQEVIKKYIDAGKGFWVIGLDLLFAKYGVPPVQFFESEFAYDYLGIENYKAQSYGNDGQTGCPQMNKSLLAPATFPAQLKWIFSTLWWADICDLAPLSKELYLMGPSDYELANGISMHYNQSEGRKVLCTFFEPALIDTYTNRVSFLKSAIDFLNIETSTVNVLPKADVKIYPNPTSDFTLVQSNQSLDKVSILSMDGRIMESYSADDNQLLKIDFSTYHVGVYFIECSNKDGQKSIHKLIKQL
jgi:Secretion system C-terminal sorting domain